MDSQYTIDKPITFAMLILFIASFPVLEGVSNEFFPIGTKILGSVVAFFWITESLFYKKIRFSLPLILLFIYLFWNAITVLWTYDIDGSIKRLWQLINVIIFYWIIMDTVIHRKNVKTLIIAYIFGIFLLVVTALFNVLTQKTYLDFYNRFSAIGTDPNNFGITVVSAIPFLFMFFKTEENLKIKIFCLIITFLFIIAALSTASVAATISLFLLPFGYILLSIFKKRFNFKPALFLIIIIIIFSFISIKYFVPDIAISRVNERLIHDVGGERANIWGLALETGLENFFFGLGTGSFLDYSFKFYSGGVQPHNIFLSALTELGIVGLILLILIWGYHFKLILKYPIKDKNEDYIKIGFLLSLIVMLIGALTLNWEVRKPIFFLWGIASFFAIKNISK